MKIFSFFKKKKYDTMAIFIGNNLVTLRKIGDEIKITKVKCHSDPRQLLSRDPMVKIVEQSLVDFEQEMIQTNEVYKDEDYNVIPLSKGCFVGN